MRKSLVFSVCTQITNGVYIKPNREPRLTKLDTNKRNRGYLKSPVAKMAFGDAFLYSVSDKCILILQPVVSSFKPETLFS